MHHSMRLYSRHRELFLRYYIWQAGWTRIPLAGRLVRRVANLYGGRLHGAYVLSTAEAERVVDIAGEVSLGPCTCRQVFRNCDNPVDTEIMVSLGRNAFVAERPQEYRNITSEEAKEVLRECHRRGLIHTIIKCRNDFYAICNCCNCCCVPLRLTKQYGIGKALTRSTDIVAEFSARQAFTDAVDSTPSEV
jgi:hypothetical protein